MSLGRHGTRSIPGCIDGLSSDRRRLAGWLRVGAEGEAPQIAIHLFRGPLAVELSLGAPREDVRERLGVDNVRFTATLDQPAPPGALTTGDLAVSADGTALGLGHSLMESDRASAVAWLGAIAPEVIVDGVPHGVAKPRERKSAVSRVPLPVGASSSDGSAVIGNDGNLFIYSGTNSLYRRYGPPGTEEEKNLTESETSAWVDLLRKRSSSFEERGITFLQTIIPEKSTTIDSGIAELTGVTRTLAGIESQIGEEPWYVSAFAVLNRGFPEPPWLRLDSHLSPVGAGALSQAIISQAGQHPAIPAPEFSAVEYITGDLTERFFGAEIPEKVPSPRSDLLDELGHSAELVHSSDPTRGGRFVGLQRTWHNPQAPIDKRVLAFGNSFFGQNPYSASRCNYWFLRMFREHHFVWLPEVDLDQVDRVMPDLVICQTNERFLSTLPSS